jgi:hypothetical protein
MNPRLLATVAAALLLLPAPSPAGPPSGLLENTLADVEFRLATLPIMAPKRTRDALVKARAHLQADFPDLLSEVTAAGGVVRALERPLRDDPSAGNLLDALLEDIAAPVQAEFDFLAFHDGTLEDPADERALDAAVRKASRKLEDLGDAARRARAARLKAACRTVARALDRLGLELPDGLGDPLPDFALVDQNPASATSGQEVSPRDYEGQISAWYFGHST